MSKNRHPRHCFSWRHKRSVPSNKGNKTERETHEMERQESHRGERQGNPQGGVAQGLSSNFRAG